jgi:hypothetical protein
MGKLSRVGAITLALIVPVGCKPFVATEPPAPASQALLSAPTKEPVRGWQEVKIYYRPPETRYEEIGLLEASSANSWASSRQGKVDKVIERLRKRAADMGANGVLLLGVGSEHGGSVNVGNATATSYGNSAYATGIGTSIAVTHKSGSAIAIYVHEHETDASTSSAPGGTQQNSQRSESQRAADKYDAILKLDDLRKRGLITEQEFESEKHKVLSEK